MGEWTYFHIFNLPDKYVVIAAFEQMFDNPIKHIIEEAIGEKEEEIHLTMIDEIINGTFDIYNYKNHRLFKRNCIKFSEYSRLFHVRKNHKRNNLHKLINSILQCHSHHYAPSHIECQFWSGENKIDFDIFNNMKYKKVNDRFY